MNYQEVLQGISYEVQKIGIDTEIKRICVDSKKVKQGDTFIALVGKKKDGHQFIEDAINNGASMIICNAGSVCPDISDDVTVICLRDTRLALSTIANNFYNNPSAKFKLVGVTGTNGKTSVTTMVNHVFRRLGYKTGLIGTINIYMNDEIIHIERTNPTTPDCLDLGNIMDLFVQNNIEFVFMEVSSMAMKMHRVQSCNFDTAVYTNLSPEHLDDHKTMEDYLNSKKELFPLAPAAVVNMDDPFADEILSASSPNCIRYGINKTDRCNLYAENIRYCSDRVVFSVYWDGSFTDFCIMIPSQFAVYNALAVIGICLLHGIELENIRDTIGEQIYIAGRYELVKGKGKTAIIDFAHTPVALENLLKSVRQNITYNKIISVFGCGGDRDSAKRKPMGSISQTYADYTIVTSDNPRTEPPQRIISEILEGMDSSINNFCFEENREQAIKMAIDMASEGDVIVISGKGHETKQIFKESIIDFNDKEIAEKYLNNRDLEIE